MGDWQKSDWGLVTRSQVMGNWFESRGELVNLSGGLVKKLRGIGLSLVEKAENFWDYGDW